MLPSANVTIDDASGKPGAGTDYLVVLSPCTDNADMTPRVFTSTAALLSFHAYCQGVDYSALHFDETRLPILFVGLPVSTAGVVSQQDDSQVDGTCVITVTGTPMDECDLELVVTRGGTIGTSSILIELSLDGGRTFKPVKLGTAVSYVVPYMGITLNFAAGTLLLDDVFTCRTSAPAPAQASIQSAREALAAQSKSERDWLCCWDAANETAADDVLAEINAYETANERFKLARLPVRDHSAGGKKSNIGEVTFAEVGVSGDTITRDAGSWIADGFRVGDVITVTGSVSNNFADGDVTGVTATVLTLGNRDLVAEVLAAGVGSITSPAEADAAWVSDIDAEFEDIADEPRLALGAGRARKLSRIHGWRLRRPYPWAASIRSYQHDVQIPSMRKADGPLSGWDLEDEDGNIIEHDERLNGGLLEAGFGCFRTWPNGPNGTFVALDLTRALPESLLSRVHHMAVVNVAQGVCQAATEALVGEVLVKQADGTATDSSLSTLETKVNSALAVALLQPGREGPRASSATWTASRTDDISVPGAILTGVLELVLNGTIEHVVTTVRVS
jgi:hypothetical protein